MELYLLSFCVFKSNLPHAEGSYVSLYFIAHQGIYAPFPHYPLKMVKQFILKNHVTIAILWFCCCWLTVQLFYNKQYFIANIFYPNQIIIII